MDEVFIDIRKTDIEDEFPNKDLITVEELLAFAEDKLYEISQLKEKIEELQNQE